MTLFATLFLKKVFHLGCNIFKALARISRKNEMLFISMANN